MALLKSLFDFNLSIDSKLQRWFVWWCGVVVKHPRKVMVWSTLLMFAGGFGFSGAVTESSVRALWVPQDSEAALNRDEYQLLFPTINTVRYSTIMVTPPATTDEDGDGVGDADMATYEALLELNDFYEKFLAIEVAYNGTNQTFSDLCWKPDPLNPDTCSIESVLDAWSYGNDGENGELKYRLDPAKLLYDHESEENDLGIKLRLSQRFETERGSRITVDSLIGGFYRNAGIIQTIQAYRFGIIFPRGEDDSPWGEAMDKFEFALGKLTVDSNYQHIEPQLLGFRTLSDELANAISGDIVLFAVGYVLMISFCCFALGNNDLVSSKKLVGLMGVISVILAVVGGIGLSCALGTPITPVTQIVPFLALGIGVDDMFIMCNSLSKTDVRLPIEKRIITGISRAGVSITITSLTDFLAFMVGTSSRLPAIRYFCVNLAFCVLFDYFMQITFFAAFLTLDGRREQKNIVDCCCFPICSVKRKVGVEGEVGGEGEGENDVFEPKLSNSLLQKFFSNVMPKLLRSPTFRKLIIISFTGMMIGGGLLGLNVESRFEVYDILTDESPLIEFFQRYYVKFDHLGSGIDVVLKEADFDYVENFDKINLMLQDLEAEESVDFGINNWLIDFREFQQCSPCCKTDAIYTLPGPNAALPVFEGHTTECTPQFTDKLDGLQGGFAKDMDTFNELLFHFLAHDYYGISHLGDVSLIDGCDFQETQESWNEKGCKLQASSFGLRHVGTLNNSPTQERVQAMFGIRAAFKPWELDGFVYCGEYLFWEQYDILDEEAAQNLSVALVCVICVCFFFLIHPAMSLVMAFCIAGIDLDIVGGMWLTGVHINVISVANLVLAIGLSVDYCSHIAHAYITMPCVDKNGNAVNSVERSINALIHIGPSVVSGGFTTFLGVLCLGWSGSNVFRIFFKMFCLTIGWGLLYGIFVIPVILAWIDLNIPDHSALALSPGDQKKDRMTDRWNKNARKDVDEKWGFRGQPMPKVEEEGEIEMVEA